MASTLARKVTKSKWNNQIVEKNKIISADAITSCLRSTNNTISVWDVDNIEDAVLALACTNTSLIVIDIVALSKEHLEEMDIEVKKVKATNPVDDLNEKHCDIVNLDYSKLGIIANKIADETIKNSDYIIRYSKSKVKEIIKKAIVEGRISIDNLDENLQKAFL